MTRVATPYRAASVVAGGAALLLLWGMGAIGIIGIEGDPGDLMYLGVLAVPISGAIVARFRADGMVAPGRARTPTLIPTPTHPPVPRRVLACPAT